MNELKLCKYFSFYCSLLMSRLSFWWAKFSTSFPELVINCLNTYCVLHINVIHLKMNNFIVRYQVHKCIVTFNYIRLKLYVKLYSFHSPAVNGIYWASSWLTLHSYYRHSIDKQCKQLFICFTIFFPLLRMTQQFTWSHFLFFFISTHFHAFVKVIEWEQTENLQIFMKY